MPKKLQQQTSFDLRVSTKRVWFIFRNTRYFGPHAIAEIQDMLKLGLISLDHFFWKPGMPSWERLRQYENFNGYKSNKPLDLSDEQFLEILNLNKSLNQFKNDESLNLAPALKARMHYFNGPVDPNIEMLLDQVESVRLRNGPKEKVRFYLHKIYRWFKALEKRTQVASATAAITFIVFGGLLIGWQIERAKRDQMLSKINGFEKSKINEVLSSSFSKNGPQAHMVIERANTREPQIVLATNIPLGEKIKIKLQGVPQTLVGQTGFSFIKTIRLESSITKIGPVRQTNGAYIPMGEYSLEVFCHTCKTIEDEVIFSGKEFIGGERDEYYFKNLISFRKSVEDRAQIELEEINDILETLKSQFNDSTRIYRQLRKSGGTQSKQQWAQFNNSWLVTQNSIRQALSELDKEGFASKLFYRDLYFETRSLSEQMMELQGFRNSIISDPSSWEIIKTRALPKYESVNQAFAELGNKISKNKLELSNNTVPIVE
ncbi:MAG: DUF4339 domain-containing protein [Bdellovibrionales bacterium]